MVLDPGKTREAEAALHKWGLDFKIIGKTTDNLRFVVRHQGEIKADLPIKELGDAAPLCDRLHIPSPKLPKLLANEVEAPVSSAQALLRLLATPDLCSKRWIFEQYDHLILGNTIQGPGGDAAVIRIGDGPKALALTVDVTQRYCEADPFEGGKQAVAEAWRNLCAVGARPLAATDNLNFGNPEKPDIMGQFIGCIDGIAEACRTLDFPIVSGNVSLYNDTAGCAIPPTPSIGGVGVLDDCAKAASLAFKQEGEAILLIGATVGWLGQSLYLREICGREEGAPPPVDLALENCAGNFVRGLIRSQTISAAHDISDGGLAIAVAEMAIAAGIGAIVTPPEALPPHGFFFGEDQARYLVTASSDRAEAIVLCAAAEGLACAIIGSTGGTALTLGGETAILVEDLKQANEDWLPTYMAG
jgi:phosphoribosylformylglycinamidine synthase